MSATILLTKEQADRRSVIHEMELSAEGVWVNAKRFGVVSRKISFTNPTINIVIVGDGSQFNEEAISYDEV